MPDPEQPELPVRRTRRRAVGPPGATASRDADVPVLGSTEHDEGPPPDDDERLLRDVPPHHGS